MRRSIKTVQFFRISIPRLIFVCLLIWGFSHAALAEEKISTFGKYQGYSREIYDSWQRSSRYLTMRDGVKLAMDIIRPAKNGQVAEDKLPVLWTHTRYRRAVERHGSISSIANAPYVQTLLKHGYVVAAVDVRGSGASYGTWQGIWTQQESLDAHEITQWLGTRPWSNGKVGMFGGSYLGITQLMCAGKGPSHLKAIFPMVALYDLYPLAYHGGIFFNDYIQHWSDLTLMLDTQSVAAPVDNDPGKKQLKRAIQQHHNNRPLIHILSSLPYRNSKDEFTGVQPYYLWHPAAFTREISQSGVAIYLWCGWFDAFTKDGFLMYKNFTNPKKLVMGHPRPYPIQAP